MKAPERHFVKIVSVYKNNLRDYKNLSLLYDDIDFLKKVINNILDKEISFKSKRVLVKPNWVLHPQKDSDYHSLYTHPNFILALINVIAEKSPKSIVIGDAPLQNCIWENLHSQSFLEEVNIIAKKYNIKIEVKDFRRIAYNFEKNVLSEELNPLSDYSIFDLGSDSALEPITKEGKNKFRVTNYDPRRMRDVHKKGIHKYCITKDFFENDIILTLPKIKTHQKAGITGALKILVGINGDKDFLPHHRIGGTGRGGDCYPGRNPLRAILEFGLDITNQYRGSLFYKIFRSLITRFWNLFLNTPYHNLGAAWYGNDTVWRMVVDLNKIALYGTQNGNLSKKPQREIFALSDGIVGGQGDGPLNPEPLPLGIIMFSNSPILNDAIIAKLMQFDLKKVPIIRDLKGCDFENGYIFMNNNLIKFDDLDDYSIKTHPSPGWKGYIENRFVRS